MSHSKGRSKTTTLIALILAGETIFVLPFVLPRVFRPTLLQVFDITNLELGYYFSVYGVIAMISYLFGGPLADRFPARNLIAIALWATALGGFVQALVLDSSWMNLIYGYWGFTTIFLFWAALIRATREWGGSDLQGSAFGLLEGGRGVIAALLGSLAYWLFSIFMPEQVGSVGEAQRNSSFQQVILATSAFTVFAGILAWIMIPVKIGKKEAGHQGTSLSSIITIMKMPVVWMQAIIIICAYVGYKMTDDISLYANVVLDFNEVDAAGAGAIMLWMRPVFAVLAGFLADRFRGSKVILGCFVLVLIGGFMIFLGKVSVFLVVLNLTITVAGVFGLRGVYFAVMNEAKIPVRHTGLAVGIMSIIGFTPEVFMSPLMGYLLDTYEGELGHQYVFGVLALFAMAGVVVSWMFVRRVEKTKV